MHFNCVGYRSRLRDRAVVCALSLTLWCDRRSVLPARFIASPPFSPVPHTVCSSFAGFAAVISYARSFEIVRSFKSTRLLRSIVCGRYGHGTTSGCGNCHCSSFPRTRTYTRHSVQPRLARRLQPRVSFFVWPVRFCVLLLVAEKTSHPSIAALPSPRTHLTGLFFARLAM